MTPEDEAHFWSYVEKGDGCWRWRLTPNGRGYTRFYLRGKKYNAHRLAYELAIGPIPEGLVIDHLCRNRACVNPAHLEPVTNAENIRRGAHGGKTHCVHGHEYTPENTRYRVDKMGQVRRACRACVRAKARAWHYAMTPEQRARRAASRRVRRPEQERVLTVES